MNRLHSTSALLIGMFMLIVFAVSVEARTLRPVQPLPAPIDEPTASRL
jgi:hypothetical protein